MGTDNVDRTSGLTWIVGVQGIAGLAEGVLAAVAVRHLIGRAPALVQRTAGPVALDHIEFVLSPDLIIIGGGVSRPERWSEFGHLLKMKAKVVPATLTNEAGIVGAAWQARKAKD